MLHFIALLLVVTSPVVQTPIPAMQSAQAQQSAPAKPASNCEGKTFATLAEAKQSGCCSWHGGVCGCSNGRTKCCDGELSPSCKC